MPQNCIRSGKCCHIYNVFKFKDTFSTSHNYKARHSQHIVFYKNFFYCPIEGPQGAKSLQWYIIMRCRKGIFELENIVNMATCCIMKKCKLYNPLFVEYDNNIIIIIVLKSKHWTIIKRQSRTKLNTYNTLKITIEREVIT
jgi:hypothetical protein